VTSAAFNRGGGLLATGGDNDTVRLWRVSGGQLLHELKGHRGSILDVAFSPRGSRLATASADGTGRIWNVATGGLVASIVGHKGYVDAVAFSPDGYFVVTGSTDRTARVSKADNGDGRALLAGHGDSVRAVAFSPDGKHVLTGSADSTARLWDPMVQPKLTIVVKAGGPVARAEYAGDGSGVLVVGPGRTVRLVDSQTGRTERTVAARGAVRAAAASPDGSRLAVASDHVVEIVGPGRERVVARSSDAVTSVAFSPDGDSIVAGDQKGGLRIWPADGGMPRAFEGHAEQIADVAFSADGLRVVTGAGDRTARIWDVFTGRCCGPSRSPRCRHLGGIQPDGRRVLTASRDHDARLWDASRARSFRCCVPTSAGSPRIVQRRWPLDLTAGPDRDARQPASEPDPPVRLRRSRRAADGTVFDPTGRSYRLRRRHRASAECRSAATWTESSPGPGRLKAAGGLTAGRARALRPTRDSPLGLGGQPRIVETYSRYAAYQARPRQIRSSRSEAARAGGRHLTRSSRMPINAR
jgi:WD40 repeat protein